MKAARNTDDGPTTGGGYGGGHNQAPAQQYDDRVECKWCGRKFNDTAAERHMPVCEKKYKENQIKTKGKTSGPTAVNKRGTSIGFRK